MSGKTSWINAVLDPSSNALVDEDDRTIGIDTRPYEFEADEGTAEIQRYEIAFWDFAGQDMYRGAYSIFYSPRTMFFCVWTWSAMQGLLVTANAAKLEAFVGNF